VAVSPSISTVEKTLEVLPVLQAVHRAVGAAHDVHDGWKY
jgi:hypothetical protein